MREDKFTLLAHVAKLADAYVSEAYGETHGGSIPLVSTFFLFKAPLTTPALPNYGDPQRES